LFTVVCHARSALDFATNFLRKFHTSPYPVDPINIEERISVARQKVTRKLLLNSIQYYVFGYNVALMFREMFLSIY